MGKRKEEGRERRKYNYNKEEEKDMTVMCVRGKNIKWGGGRWAGIGKRESYTQVNKYK